MAKNIDRVLRIVDAAAALIHVEAAWNAGKGRKRTGQAHREGWSTPVVRQSWPAWPALTPLVFERSEVALKADVTPAGRAR